MQELFAALVAFLFVHPIEAELADRLAAARAPQEVIVRVTGCAESAVPNLVDRITGDPLWAVSTAVSLWGGWADAVEVLADTAPQCADAVGAAREAMAARTS